MRNYGCSSVRSTYAYLDVCYLTSDKIHFKLKCCTCQPATTTRVSSSANDACVLGCDQASHREFIELTGLPDNFQSWFLIQQLHVWMVMVRAKQEGSLGTTFYKQLGNPMLSIKVNLKVVFFEAISVVTVCVYVCI